MSCKWISFKGNNFEIHWNSYIFNPIKINQNFALDCYLSQHFKSLIYVFKVHIPYIGHLFANFWLYTLYWNIYIYFIFWRHILRHIIIVYFVYILYSISKLLFSTLNTQQIGNENKNTIMIKIKIKNACIFVYLKYFAAN